MNNLVQKSTLPSGRTCVVHKVGVRDALRMHTKVVSTLAEAISKADVLALLSAAENSKDGGNQVDAIKQFAGAVSVVDPDKFYDLVVELASLASVDGKKAGDDFDAIFDPDPSDVYVAAWKVASFNIGDFLSGLLQKGSTQGLTLKV